MHALKGGGVYTLREEKNMRGGEVHTLREEKNMRWRGKSICASRVEVCALQEKPDISMRMTGGRGVHGDNDNAA